METNPPDAFTIKLIFAELVSHVETLHIANILHQDISMGNILIGNDGHLVLADFAMATRLTDDIHVWDWALISCLCRTIFSNPIVDENELRFKEMLDHMTDAQLPGKSFYPMCISRNIESVRFFKRIEESSVFQWD